MMDPLDWFRKLKEISEETAITPRTTQHARMNLAIKDAVHLQENLIPGLAMVARTASPMESQMSVTFVQRALKNAKRRRTTSDNKVQPERTPIVLDTGASISVTPFLSDFVTDLEDVDTEMRGLSESIQVEGKGTVEWPTQDFFGRVALVRTKAYLVPKGNIRLFSPQAYFREAIS